MKNFKNYPIKCSDTNEIIYNYREYLTSEHWENLKNRYLTSGLSKICQRCNKSDITYDFYHKTYKRIGEEYLIDIIPLCKECYYSLYDVLKENTNSRRNLWNIQKKGKKKILRKQLKPYSFDPLKMSKEDLNIFLNIKPIMRGVILSKYFSEKTKGLHINSQWINKQVQNACRWIRKELIKNELETQKRIQEIKFEENEF